MCNCWLRAMQSFDNRDFVDFSNYLGILKFRYAYRIKNRRSKMQNQFRKQIIKLRQAQNLSQEMLAKKNVCFTAISF